jgi:hypothetical protein
VKSNPIPLIRGLHSTQPTEFDPSDSVKGRVQRVVPDLTLFAAAVDLGAPVHGPTIVRILKESETVDDRVPVWRTHFYDCHSADQHRKKKR